MFNIEFDIFCVNLLTSSVTFEHQKFHPALESAAPNGYSRVIIMLSQNYNLDYGDPKTKMVFMCGDGISTLSFRFLE